MEVWLDLECQVRVVVDSSNNSGGMKGSDCLEWANNGVLVVMTGMAY